MAGWRELDVLGGAGHPGSVKCVAWSPDGTRVAAGHTDGTVHVWGVLQTDD